jgi:hypothetical protein
MNQFHDEVRCTQFVHAEVVGDDNVRVRQPGRSLPFALRSLYPSARPSPIGGAMILMATERLSNRSRHWYTVLMPPLSMRDSSS